MKIIFTQHAKDRLRQRGIKTTEVRQAIAAPLVRKPAQPPAEMIEKVVNKQTLRVIFKQTNDTFVIITAYYL